MAEKTRVRTRARKQVSGAIHAVGQGRPRKNSSKNYADELITGNIKVPEIIAEDKLACQFWETSSEILILRKVLKPAHVPLLMMYCTAASTYFSTPAQIVAKGLAEEDLKTGALRPSIATVKHQAYQQMIKAGSLLGLDPLSELRTGLLKEDKEKDAIDARSDFSQFD